MYIQECLAWTEPKKPFMYKVAARESLLRIWYTTFMLFFLLHILLIICTGHTILVKIKWFVNLWKTRGEHRAAVQPIIAKMAHLCNQLRLRQFRLVAVRREANQVAHSCAHQALASVQGCTWFARSPVFYPSLWE